MIRLDPRLRCAFELLQGAVTVADIGCDHGKLTAALLLEGGCRRVIAGDISPEAQESPDAEAMDEAQQNETSKGSDDQ